MARRGRKEQTYIMVSALPSTINKRMEQVVSQEVKRMLPSLVRKSDQVLGSRKYEEVLDVDEDDKDEDVELYLVQRTAQSLLHNIFHCYDKQPYRMLDWDCQQYKTTSCSSGNITFPFFIPPG